MIERGHQRALPPTIASELVITDQLASRPAQRLSPETEVSALRAFASKMADTPEELLSAYVKLAMEVTDAAAAGLALVDEHDPELLVWRYLHGSMTAFENRISRRVESKSPVAMRAGEPMLLTQPKAFSWTARAGLSFPEAVAVRVDAAGEFVGILWVGAASMQHFDSGDAHVLAELSTLVGVALNNARKVADLHHLLEDQVVIASEMRHRLKNIFAVADGLVRATAKHAASPEEMADALTGRLHALEKAHALLRIRKGSVSPLGGHTALDQLLTAITGVYSSPSSGELGPILLEGPAVACGDHATNGFALVMNELATNAAKYGAWSRPGGRVEIKWEIEGDELLLGWSEKGGPEITTAPLRQGFGSSLVERTVSSQFRGTVDRQWLRSGLVVRMRLSMPRIRA